MIYSKSFWWDVPLILYRSCEVLFWTPSQTVVSCAVDFTALCPLFSMFHFHVTKMPLATPIKHQQALRFAYVYISVSMYVYIYIYIGHAGNVMHVDCCHICHWMKFWWCIAAWEKVWSDRFYPSLFLTDNDCVFLVKLAGTWKKYCAR